MRFYLGVDNGGSMTKAALFDMDGKLLGSTATPTSVYTPRPDFVERDMEEMWRTNCKVISSVISKCRVDPKKIAGVGICGHGKGLYLWGKDNKPVRNGIVSTDNRAHVYSSLWRADGTESKAFEFSNQHVMSCQPVALLAWLRDNEPKSFEKIKWIFECKDYVRFRLTGEARAEITDYSGSGLLNLSTGKYDDRLLRLFGLETVKAALPDLCTSGEICGYVTEEAGEACGLVPGTPVAGGMFDIDACALASGITDERNICMIAGTWSINEYIRREPVLDGSVAMNSLYCLPEYYLVEESSPTSTANQTWFTDALLPELMQKYGENNVRLYEQLNSWVESIPADEFIPVFLPFLMASNVHPNARAAFVGLSANHNRKHMLRSVYEGIVFSHRYHMEKLMKSRIVDTNCVRLSGGAARSTVWTQMFADVLKLPVETVNVGETGALGCAMAVAAAVGDYPSLKDAAEAMCPVSTVVYPQERLFDIYDAKYKLYLATLSCLDELWDRMQRVAERKGAAVDNR